MINPPHQMDLLDINNAYENEEGRNSPNAQSNYICTGSNGNHDVQSSIFFNVFTKIESYIKNSTM